MKAIHGSILAIALMFLVSVGGGLAWAQVSPDPEPSLATPPYQGFGGSATGGAGKPVYHVTNCKADSSPGSLKAAVSQGNRYVVFDVACGPGSGNSLPTFGNTWVYVKGSNITIDGFTAPFPGYQYLGTIAIGGQYCSPRCNNVIVRGLIYRPDGRTITNFALKVERGAHRIVFDHNTMVGCGNDCIGSSAGEGTTFVDTRDITISRNLIIRPFRLDPGTEGNEYGAQTAMLITSRTRRVSILNNLIYDSKRRNPRVTYDKNVNSPDTIADIRGNVMYLVSGASSQDGGVGLFDRVRVNVVGNYLLAKAGLADAFEKKVLHVCKGGNSAAEDMPWCSRVSGVEKVYISGNVHGNGWSTAMNRKGTVSTPLPAPPVPSMDACTAARSVLKDVGSPHKSFSDLATIRNILLTGCQVIVDPPPPPPPPSGPTHLEVYGGLLVRKQAEEEALVAAHAAHQAGTLSAEAYAKVLARYEQYSTQANLDWGALTPVPSADLLATEGVVCCKS